MSPPDVPSTVVDPMTVAVVAARAIDAKLGREVVVLPVGDLLAITEFFVIGHATNPRQVSAIADEVLRAVRADCGRGPLRTEGVREQQWVLIDYGDVVVHVFGEDTRAFYEIERLYKDVVPVTWQE